MAPDQAGSVCAHRVIAIGCLPDHMGDAQIADHFGQQADKQNRKRRGSEEDGWTLTQPAPRERRPYQHDDKHAGLDDGIREVIGPMAVRLQTTVHECHPLLNGEGWSLLPVQEQDGRVDDTVQAGSLLPGLGVPAARRAGLEDVDKSSLRCWLWCLVWVLAGWRRQGE